MKTLIGRGEKNLTRPVLKFEGYKNVKDELPEVGRKISLLSYYKPAFSAKPATYGIYTGTVRSNLNGIRLDWPVKILRVKDNNIIQEGVEGNPSWETYFHIEFLENHVNLWKYESGGGRLTRKRKGRSRRVVR